jgi:hypothetical protein
MLLADNIHKFGEPFTHCIVGLFISILNIHMVKKKIGLKKMGMRWLPSSFHHNKIYDELCR